MDDKISALEATLEASIDCMEHVVQRTAAKLDIMCMFKSLTNDNNQLRTENERLKEENG